MNDGLMYCAQIPFGTPAFDEILALRDRGLRQPLGLAFKSKDIVEEWRDLHFGCYDRQDRLLGTCSYVDSGEYQYKMRQVCVHPYCRGRGVGALMVRKTEEELLWRFDARRIFLHARERSLPFYLRMNYIREGEKFTEVDIPHYFMFKILSDDKS